MRISTKGIYALEIITDLALHSEGDSLESLKNIASRRGLSEKYLERIVKGMKEKKLVVSVRGAHGGYGLAREASQITVKEVLMAAEGELAPVACLTKETDCGVDCGLCPTRGIWSEIWEGILGTAEAVTIQDIIDEAGSKKVTEMENIS